MTTAVETFAAQWQDWHQARERALTTPHGWLTLTSFHWLPGTPTPLPGLPGRFWVSRGQAVFEGSAQDGVRVLSAEGEVGGPVLGETRAQVAEARSLEWLAVGDVVVELALRGGRYAVRTRDPQAPALLQFAGVPTFDLDPGWIVEGTVEHFDAPRRIEVRTARADLVQYLTAVAAITLDIDGRAVSLLATAGAGGTFTLAFADATSGDSTAPWRSVSTSVPDAEGRLRVDFNRAVNFPFAFSDYGTCPAPPAGNILPVAVTAGERAPLRVES